MAAMTPDKKIIRLEDYGPFGHSDIEQLHGEHRKLSKKPLDSICLSGG